MSGIRWKLATVCPSGKALKACGVSILFVEFEDYPPTCFLPLLDCEVGINANEFLSQSFSRYAEKSWRSRTIKKAVEGAKDSVKKAVLEKVAGSLSLNADSILRVILVDEGGDKIATLSKFFRPHGSRTSAPFLWSAALLAPAPDLSQINELKNRMLEAIWNAEVLIPQKRRGRKTESAPSPEEVVVRHQDQFLEALRNLMAIEEASQIDLGYERQEIESNMNLAIVKAEEALRERIAQWAQDSSEVSLKIKELERKESVVEESERIVETSVDPEEPPRDFLSRALGLERTPKAAGVFIRQPLWGKNAVFALAYFEPSEIVVEYAPSSGWRWNFPRK